VKTLIAEDNSTSRLLLRELLKSDGQVPIAVNGREAVAAARLALKAAESYELICLDIMMPKMDGQEALTRRTETAAGVEPHQDCNRHRPRQSGKRQGGHAGEMRLFSNQTHPGGCRKIRASWRSSPKADIF